MMNAILRQAVAKKVVHPEPGNKVSFDYEQFVDRGYVAESNLRDFNLNICAQEEAKARCQLLAAHLLSLTIDPDTRKDEDQMNQRMLEYTRRVIVMRDHLTHLHFDESFRVDKTAHRMGQRAEQREYERIILYILLCAENQYKDNRKFDRNDYAPWFLSKDYNAFNLRRRFQRGIRKMRDQASLPFLHERHYRDLFKKYVVSWMAFVHEFQLFKDNLCHDEYKDYYEKYKGEEMLYDSDDNGKTDRKEYEKKVTSTTYKPRVEPQPVTELSDDDKERLRILMERINGIPIASAAAPPPPPPPPGPAVALPKAEAYSKPKVDGEPGFVQEFRERVHESAQLVKFVDENFTSADHGIEKKHS